ncbi:MAG: quinone-dependent dihydroorotate dehydrogenase [Methylococcaceae bacterium]
MNLYARLRPLLFQINPETAHHLGIAVLQGAARLDRWNPFQEKPCDKPVELMGLTFPNPIGMAAGFDKNGECIEGLSSLGFGFIEVGTVTPRPQMGNPLPRLFRIPEHQALINRMGFNNKGVDYLLEQIDGSDYTGILGINIGKNRDTPNDRALNDYAECLEKVYSKASYVTINISSPNTPGLRELQTTEVLDQLLDGLMCTRTKLADTHGRCVPLLVKIAPDLDSEAIKAMAEIFVRHKVDGIIATNTTATRFGVEQHPVAKEAGGMSGRPLKEHATAVVAELHAALGDSLPIIACGGIFNATDVQEKLAAGARLVQVYTALIYEGTSLVTNIMKKLNQT